ncbi:MAG: FAD-binding protein [bacterium]
MTGPGGLTPTIQVAKNKTWQNWHQSVKQKVARLVNVWNAQPNVPSIASYNATTAALQGLIAQAERDGLGLRAAGGTWSFTPVAVTDGVLINTRPLNYRFWLKDADLHRIRQGRADYLVFAQCGTSISELNTALHARGKSLRTSGASNGQTIAGAIGTGTHGSAIDQGALHDSVVALHVITASDRHVWLERASAPVASAEFVQSLDAEFLADDALFDAALVSFGSFGVVHGVVVEVDDLFWLQEYRKQHPDAPGTWAAIERLDFTGLQLPRPGVRPYFFQALFNPYDRTGGPYLTVMYRDAQDPGGPRPDHHDKWRPGDSAAELIANATDLGGGTPPAIGRMLMQQLYPDVDGECGRWGDMFWDTSSRGRLASTALGIPIARAREAVDVLYDVNAKYKIPGVFALRYVRASRGTLAFTRHREATCVLEVDGAYSKRMKDFYEAAWDKLGALGIPFSFHWGKMQPVNATLLLTMYGQEAADAWRRARTTLLRTAAVRVIFTNQLLEELGMHT